jgi:uncharacterized protein YcgI (DUF1989 family)
MPNAFQNKPQLKSELGVSCERGRGDVLDATAHAALVVLSSSCPDENLGIQEPATIPVFITVRVWAVVRRDLAFLVIAGNRLI